jgi:hypothetical protein
MHDPSLDGAMIHNIASLLHQFLQIAIAEGISDVPPYALQYDILLVVAAFKADHDLPKFWNSAEDSIAWQEKCASLRQNRCNHNPIFQAQASYLVD